MIHQTVKTAISKVEEGKFDSFLQILENKNLGIFVNAYANEGQVLPIPDGYHQSESNLEICLSNEKEESAVQVGWYGQIHALCSNHPSCEDYAHQKYKPEEDVLANAAELVISSTQEEAEKHRNMLDELFADGLGLFIVHGHSRKFTFSELPQNCIAVIENGKTNFRYRKDVINITNFVPNIWRMENGVRQVVGGFIV